MRNTSLSDGNKCGGLPCSTVIPSTNGTIKKFDAAGGTVVVNGVSYTITSGNFQTETVKPLESCLA